MKRNLLTRNEAWCLAALVVITGVAGWQLLGGGVLLGQDWATQFYPWYSYLGERLHALQLPYWNPSQFTGAPFMSDPQSGWTYWPAMALFTLFPIELAAALFALFHLALAGFGAYALSRALGVVPAGALTAATVYELSGPVLARSACCPVQVQVSAWMPVLLLGAELARRQPELSRRFPGMIIGGIAMSQILASWLGQGSYYAILVVVSYLVYRTMLDPDRWSKGFRTGLGVSLVASGGIVLLGFGLAAAGIIPRLEYNSLTNLAGGVYDSTDATLGGWTAGADSFATMTRRFYYPGGVAIALALMAVALSRLRYATPYFLGLIVAALVLGSHRETPLHSLLYATLPRFEDLHSHWPERITMVAFLGVAMLAGAAVGSLSSWTGRVGSLAMIGLIPVAVAAGFELALAPASDRLPGIMLVGVGAAVLVVIASGVSWWQPVARYLPVLLVVIIAVDFIAAARDVFAYGPYGGFYRVDLGDYYARSGGQQFLAAQQNGPARYFGYNPIMRSNERGQFVLYRYQFASQATAALLVNNRATYFGGIEDIQGYNPIQYQLYVDYFQDLNGHDQDYHDANVYPDGLDSPLLDLLNARYVVIPVDIPPDRVDLAKLAATLPTVYQDEEVRILERPSAADRAWLVHEVEQATPAQARALIVTGLVDPSKRGLVDGAPPVMAPFDPVVAETIQYLEQKPERLKMTVTAGGDALLIVSEVAHPSWRAAIDGVETPILTVDGLFRGVVVTGGEHTVEFWYEGQSERLGLVVSGLTILTTAGMGWFVIRRERTGNSG